MFCLIALAGRDGFSVFVVVVVVSGRTTELVVCVDVYRLALYTVVV